MVGHRRIKKRQATTSCRCPGLLAPLFHHAAHGARQSSALLLLAEIVEERRFRLGLLLENCLVGAEGPVHAGKKRSIPIGWFAGILQNVSTFRKGDLFVQFLLILVRLVIG